MKHIGCFATQKEEKAHLKRLKGEEKYEAHNEMIASCRHIAFFGGAGVSTESGIPDFRSKDGLYNQHDVRFDAYQPEYLLSNPCLEREPKVFYEFYRQKMDARGINPNKAHYKLAEMEAKGKLDGVITQNIDGLHQLAGSKVVYEVHGSTLRNYCDRCGKKYPSDAIYESSEAVRRKDPSRCHIIRGDASRGCMGRCWQTDRQSGPSHSRRYISDSLSGFQPGKFLQRQISCDRQP